MNVKTLLNRLLFGLDNLSLFPKIKPVMERENVQSLMQASGFFSFILAILIPFSVSVNPFPTVSKLYIFGFVCSFSVFLLTKFVFRTNGKVTLVLFYIQICVAFTFGVFLTNYGINKGAGVTFLVLLVAMPLLISDFAWRIDILLILATVVFVVTSHKTKTPDVFEIDIVNAVCFLALALYINTMQQIRRFSDYYHTYMIKRQRDIDSLTGLLNKTALELRIRTLLTATNIHGAMMILDMDDFKAINDQYGHAVGDYVITMLGKCLKSVTRETDIVGRFGGDEFIMFFEGLSDEHDIVLRAKDLVDEMHRFFDQTVDASDVTVSVGCVAVTDECRDYEILFNHIDKALYRAKASGKNTYCMYDPSWDTNNSY